MGWYWRETPREDPFSSPSKKGKVVDSLEGKETAVMPKPKRKATRLGDTAYLGATPSSKPEEGS